MADNNEEGRINVDSFDFANEGASEETPMLVNYLITRLQQAMANPVLQGEVQQQLQAYGFIPPHQEERIPEKSFGETSKRGISKVREGWELLKKKEAIGDDGHALRRKESFMSRSVEKYASLLRHCTSSKSLSAGQLLHDSIVRDFPLPPPLLFNLLIHMYGSCGALPESRSTFDLMPHPNIFSWNLIMAAYLSNGHSSSALSLFRSLHLQGSCSPDSVTFVSALSACSLELCFSEGSSTLSGHFKTCQNEIVFHGMPCLLHGFNKGTSKVPISSFFK
ncbi:hypothetical protein L7F22_063643 [Adiantum nelumboides]|nr:hypothetical protein [Adiantum nelumboides]